LKRNVGKISGKNLFSGETSKVRKAPGQTGAGELTEALSSANRRKKKAGRVTALGGRKT